MIIVYIFNKTNLTLMLDVPESLLTQKFFKKIKCVFKAHCINFPTTNDRKGKNGHLKIFSLLYNFDLILSWRTRSNFHVLEDSRISY